MLTPFGKALRNIRMDKGILLRDMAKKLGYSSSALSTIENGKVNIPPGMVDLIGSTYDLTEDEIENLQELERKSVRVMKLKLNAYSRSDWDFLYNFVTNFKKLNSQDKDAIKKIIQKEGSDNGGGCKKIS